MADKLIITSHDGSSIMVRVSKRANALIEEVARESGQSKAAVASRMIEFAYDHVEIIKDKE
jgi:hypothetical protein